MNKLISFGIGLLGMLTLGCNSNAVLGDAKAPSSVEEITMGEAFTQSGVIESSQDQNVDPKTLASLEFETDSYNFGEAIEGEIIEHTFKFKNTGPAPLVITRASSTCGCTVPKWPNEPIAVGETGEINVKFNTKNKTNRQRKPVTILANTMPKETVVFIEGLVKKPK